MNVNCLSCGHLLDLRDAYDDYQGQVRCFICGSLLKVHSAEGHLKSVELARSPQQVVASLPEESK
jgi:DNA-directed RNA polymerase subunit N (RpoN/RPB10)